MGVSSSRSTDIAEGGEDSSFDFACQRAKGRLDNKFKDFGGYLPLYKAALKGEWNEARKFFDQDPKALTAKITIAGETALHIAVGTGENKHFVEKLIRKMSYDDLAVIDQNGETALMVAAVVGSIEAAKLLVNKNPDLPNISGKFGFAIHKAAQCGQKEMVQYLLHVTRSDIEPSPFVGESGVELLVAVIIAEFFDIALYLVEQFPEMATLEINGKGSALEALSRKTEVFGRFGSVMHWNQLFIHLCEYAKRAIQRKLKQDNQALQLLKLLCMEICGLDDVKAFSLLQKPLHHAAKLGIPKIIEEIVNACPPVIWSTDEEKRNMFQLAVIHRRENVFSLIYQMTRYKSLVTRQIDQKGNNILHLAGQLPAPDRLNFLSGAALQLQRELKWFWKVQSLVPLAQREVKNKEGKTPKTVFRDAHQTLMKDGGEWMKTTATSCTVAATLIATVAFGAAMHVPGGNNTHDGHSLLFHHNAFGVFAMAVGVSLFSSVTAILMFLSILTSRYSEDDFLWYLPTGLIIGLVMLFVSLLSMMVAFGAAIILVFGPGKAKILIPAGAVVVSVVTLFVLLPLLYQLITSTYGSIFYKHKRRDIVTLH